MVNAIYCTVLYKIESYISHQFAQKRGNNNKSLQTIKVNIQ